MIWSLENVAGKRTSHRYYGVHGGPRHCRSCQSVRARRFAHFLELSCHSNSRSFIEYINTNSLALLQLDTAAFVRGYHDASFSKRFRDNWRLSTDKYRPLPDGTPQFGGNSVAERKFKTVEGFLEMSNTAVLEARNTSTNTTATGLVKYITDSLLNKKKLHTSASEIHELATLDLCIELLKTSIPNPPSSSSVDMNIMDISEGDVEVGAPVSDEIRSQLDKLKQVYEQKKWLGKFEKELVENGLPTIEERKDQVVLHCAILYDTLLSTMDSSNMMNRKKKLQVLLTQTDDSSTTTYDYGDVIKAASSSSSADMPEALQYYSSEDLASKIDEIHKIQASDTEKESWAVELIEYIMAMRSGNTITTPALISNGLMLKLVKTTQSSFDTLSHSRVTCGRTKADTFTG
jgi:hypothetical protein